MLFKQFFTSFLSWILFSLAVESSCRSFASRSDEFCKTRDASSFSNILPCLIQTSASHPFPTNTWACFKHRHLFQIVPDFLLDYIGSLTPQIIPSLPSCVVETPWCGSPPVLFAPPLLSSEVLPDCTPSALTVPKLPLSSGVCKAAKFQERATF